MDRDIRIDKDPGQGQDVGLLDVSAAWVHGFNRLTKFGDPCTVWEMRQMPHADESGQVT